MARKLKMSASELNIRLHPHSKDTYIRFMNSLFDLRKPFKLYGDRYGIISILQREPDAQGLMQGTLSTFTRIDTNGDWFDVNKLKIASNEQVKGITIPNGMFPNNKVFYFLFFPEKHRIYVQKYTNGNLLTSSMACKYFESASMDLDIMKEFNQAKIDIVQDKSALSKIFGIERIDSIYIVINKPNSDILSDNFEEKIEAHLAEVGGKQMSISYEAERGQSLRPDDDINRIAQVALDNGSVTVKGKEDGKSITESTSSYPVEIQDTYDSETVPEDVAFRSLVNNYNINNNMARENE